MQDLSSLDSGFPLPPNEKWSGSPQRCSSGDTPTAESKEICRDKLSLSTFATANASSRGQLASPKLLMDLRSCLTSSEPGGQGSTRRLPTSFDDADVIGWKGASASPVKSAGRTWIQHKPNELEMHDEVPLWAMMQDYAPLGSLIRNKLNSSKSYSLQPRSAIKRFPDESSADSKPFFRPSSVVFDEPLPFYRPARPATNANEAPLKKTFTANDDRLISSVDKRATAPSAAHLADATIVPLCTERDEPLQLHNNKNGAAGKAAHPQPFLSKYEITKSYIATGSTCYVMEVKLRPHARVSSEAGGKDSAEPPCVDAKSGDDIKDEKYACKVITVVRENDARKDDNEAKTHKGDSMSKSRDDVIKELEVLEQLSSHRRILQLRDVFWSDRGDVCYVITSLAEGGDLHEKLKRDGPIMDEEEAKTAMQQILEGIAFMHGKGFAHRDMKLSNIVIKTVASKVSETPEPSVEYQIADFGMSKHLSQDDESFGKHTICGTPNWVAPEILECPVVCQWSGKKQAQYGRKIDVWSCGVMLFTMLSGKLPFTGKGIGDLFCSIKTGKIDWTGPAWKKVSEEAKDLVRLLLTTNPAERPTAEEALAHAWITTDFHL